MRQAIAGALVSLAAILSLPLAAWGQAGVASSPKIVIAGPESSKALAKRFVDSYGMQKTKLEFEFKGGDTESTAIAQFLAGADMLLLNGRISSKTITEHKN